MRYSVETSLRARLVGQSVSRVLRSLLWMGGRNTGFGVLQSSSPGKLITHQVCRDRWTGAIQLAVGSSQYGND